MSPEKLMHESCFFKADKLLNNFFLFLQLHFLDYNNKKIRL